jgi:hypothetical protein
MRILNKRLKSLTHGTLTLAGAAFVLAATQAQTFKLYDQMTNPDVGLDGGGGAPLIIRTNQPLGQSFVPALTEVDFIEVYLNTYQGLRGAETETVSLFLREDSITGQVLGETGPVSFTYDGTGRLFIQEFSFAEPLRVDPGRTYVFEARHIGGDDLVQVAVIGQDCYPGGQAIWQGKLWQGLDIWFREGVVAVPEPRMWALMPLLAAALLVVKRRRRQLDASVGHG